MKYRVGFLFHRIIYDNWSWECTILPSLRLERNKHNFIASGVVGDWWGLYINFLIWDIGIKIYQDY